MSFVTYRIIENLLYAGYRKQRNIKITKYWIKLHKMDKT